MDVFDNNKMLLTTTNPISDKKNNNLKRVIFCILYLVCHCNKHDIGFLPRDPWWCFPPIFKRCNISIKASKSDHNVLRIFTGAPKFTLGFQWGSCYSMFCRLLFVLLSFFFCPLCCLTFFDLWILISPLVSSNSFFTQTKTYEEF